MRDTSKQKVSVFCYRSLICPLLIEAAGPGIVRVRFQKGGDRDNGYDFSRVKRELDAYFGGRRKRFTVNLIYEKNTFAGKVMSALRRIPSGKTVSYGALAEKAGFKGACRAVGNVMAKNRLPIFVPCHRVIKSDGSLGNFGAGTRLKQRLLRLEGALA